MSDGRTDVSRALAAKSFLDDPVVQEAFTAAEQVFMKEWRTEEDRDRRDLAWAKVQGIDEVKRQLRIYIQSGDHALIVEQRQRKSAERLSRK